MKKGLTKLILLTTIYFFSLGRVFSQCSGNEPVVFLGNDTILCKGQNLNLLAISGYNSYSWSTGDTTSAINVNSAGTYIVEATLFVGNSNLVVNGDFEAGDSGFTSSYGFVSSQSPTALWNPGYYAIGSNPNNYHSNFYSCSDKTSGSGLMYIANGASTANTIIWSQTINVQVNTNYNFSAWVSSVENTSSPAVLQFFVNGTQIGNVFSPSSTGCDWGEFYNLWNSGTNTSAVISIVNQNTEPSGNDFALDDISFIPYCTNVDTIKVSYDPISVDAGQNLVFCSASSESLTAVSNESTALFQWNTGENTATINPTVSDTYYITAISENNCFAFDSVKVQINPSPTALFSASSLTNLIPFTDNFQNLSSPNFNYSWLVDDNLIFSTSILDSFSYEFTQAGNYTITLIVSDSNNCSDTMKLTVLAIGDEFLEIPNIFSPDSDGVNDVYRFNMGNIKTISLLIFNRWGQEMRELNDPKESWDGRDQKGNDASEGVYFYKFNAISGSGKEYKGEGFIQLVR